MEMVFPTDDEMSRCTDWCAPIHKVEVAIRGSAVGKYFVIEHFMCMGKVVAPEHPDLILNKHVFTRRYLNLDADGRAYRYVAPPEISDDDPGTYVPYANLDLAVDLLELVDMPWMCDEFEHERHGLTYDERGRHPDVIAWEDRMMSYSSGGTRRARRRRPAARP